jgi:hypothetical protein
MHTKYFLAPGTLVVSKTKLAIFNRLSTQITMISSVSLRLGYHLKSMIMSYYPEIIIYTVVIAQCMVEEFL